METKMITTETKTEMITIPFDIELAKKVQNGELPGKIVTKNGKDVIVLYWDLKGQPTPIVIVIKDKIGKYEHIGYRQIDGQCRTSRGCAEDIILKVPEWAQYKEGDILACENHHGPNDYCKWFAILRGKVDLIVSNIGFSSYVSYDYDSSYKTGELTYDEYADNIHSIRLATEEEKQLLINALKKSTDPRAKEYIKRFFGIEEKPEYKFEPFQQVLVKYDDGEPWEAAFFSHYDEERNLPYWVVGSSSYKYCIPYNEKTKHLLGTTDDWEEE